MKLVNQSSTCAANGYHLCFAGPYSIKITGSLARLNSTTNLTHDCPIATLTTYTSGDGLANVKAHGSFPSGTLINATKASSNTIRINTFDGDKAHNCTAYYQITDGTYLGATVGTTASSSTVTSSNGCFSGDASAVTETSAGSVISKSMRDLAIGDRVLVSQQAGKTGFEEIFMFTHRSSEQAASISMMTASGSSLQVTPDHYMLAQKAKSLSSSSPSIIAASAIKVGDRLWTTPKNAANGELTWSTVTSVRQTTQQGLYNPHTPSGTIVVDGVAACTFPDRLPASFAAHAWATLPARVLHRMLMTNKLRTIVNDALLAGYFHLQNAYSSVLVPSMARAAAQAVRAS
ncbi:hypothetical protein WJX74_002720 [Apatococcus lobatus]|uniref:Hint domain-containing protein n=1 Tax=Apatococcus lobatus TaxID=904363 RepID=A0AAW1QCN2_9CHLO